MNVNTITKTSCLLKYSFRQQSEAIWTNAYRQKKCSWETSPKNHPKSVFLANMPRLTGKKNQNGILIISLQSIFHAPVETIPHHFAPLSSPSILKNIMAFLSPGRSQNSNSLDMTGKKNTSSLLLTFFYCMKFQEQYQLDFFLTSLEVIFVSLRSINTTLKCWKPKSTERMKKKNYRKRLSEVHIPPHQ